MASNSGYVLQDLLFGIGGSAAAPNGGVCEKLSYRTDVKPQWIADAVLNLSRFYQFDDLEDTGPLVSLAAGQYAYPLATFLNPTDVIASATLIPSFYIYYSYNNTLNPAYNPGNQLAYKSIDSLEIMFGTAGVPAYFTRFKNQILVAPVPDQSYNCYLRYQKQHPFSKPAALTDLILLPDDWREIAEYAAAVRGAGNLRMLDFAQSYKQTLHGDPKNPGELGLIKATISQNESTIISGQSLRQIRPSIRRG